MRTLDEVITAMENLTTCDDTGFSYIAHDDAVDVLHYLVEYRACQQHMEVVEQIRQDAVRQRDAHIKALGDLTRNDPLSWEELRTMEGKPVWVEYNFQISDKEFRDNSKRWCIIREFKPWHDTEIIITDNGFVLSKNEQVTDWQGYRKERNENAG